MDVDGADKMDPDCETAGEYLWQDNEESWPGCQGPWCP